RGAAPARRYTARGPYLVLLPCDRRRPGGRSYVPWGSPPTAFPASLFRSCRPCPKCLGELDKDSVCSGALSIGIAPARLSFRVVVLRLMPLLTCSRRSFSGYDARDARDHEACLLGGGGQLHRVDGVRTNHRYRRRRKGRRAQGGRHGRALRAVPTAVSGGPRALSA